MCYREPDKGFIGGINLDKKFTDRDQSTSTISILADEEYNLTISILSVKSALFKNSYKFFNFLLIVR